MQTLARSTLVLAALAAGCEPPVASPVTTPVTVALFDPLATPPVVPTPNDLAFTGGDGMHLNVPDLPTDSPAQRRFNAYLNTLNGFPTASNASASFTAPIDPATVNTGSVLVFDLTSGTMPEVTVT